MVFERSGLAIAKEKKRKKRERNKNKGKERIDDMMMMREFLGILGLGFPFYSISLLIRTIGKRREKERNLRRERERERTAKTCIAARHFSTRIYFFYFIIMTGKLTMTFSLVSSMVLDRARRLPFFFPFSFFLFLFWGGISIIMIMIIITIVMAMAIDQSERKMENRSSSKGK